MRRLALADHPRAQLSEALPALVAAVTLNPVSMIEYSAIAGTIGAGGIGYLAVVYGYQRFDNHIMIATIITLIATIQLIQFSVTVWSTNFATRRGSLHDNRTI